MKTLLTIALFCVIALSIGCVTGKGNVRVNYPMGGHPEISGQIEFNFVR